MASAMTIRDQHGNDSVETGKLLNGFFRISLTMPATFAVVAMLDIIEASDSGDIAEALVAHPDFESWQKRFGKDMETMQKNG